MTHQDDLSILEDYIDRCSNWGRWGPDDEVGTVNLITQGKVREAAALVKVGKTISLTMPYDSPGRRTATSAEPIPICTSSRRDLDTSPASNTPRKRRPW